MAEPREAKPSTVLPELPPQLPLRRISADAVLVRINRATLAPLYFGRTCSQRFDDPEREYGVCYLGTTHAASFVETVLRGSIPMPGRFLSRQALGERHFTDVRLTRPIKLVRFYGKYMGRFGADASVVHGMTYDASWAWSRHLWSHAREPDGIIYHPRHDDDVFAIALFDRAETAVVAGRSVPLDADPELLAGLLKRYQVSVGTT